MVPVLGRVDRHRTDGAMVRIITPLSPSGSEADGDRRMGDVAARLCWPHENFVPD